MGDEEESDNESTLSKEEEEFKGGSYEDELTALNNDAGGDLDDLLASVSCDSHYHCLKKVTNYEEREIELLALLKFVC